MFLENFRKLAGTVMETIIQNVQVIQKWIQVRGPFYQFSKHFVMVVPNTDQKRIPLNDNIAWWKYSSVSKDLLKSESFFLLNAPKYLDARLFYSFYPQTLRIFWNVFLSRKIRET